MYRKFEELYQKVNLYEGEEYPTWDSHYPHTLHIHLHFKSQAGMRKVKTHVLKMLGEELKK